MNYTGHPNMLKKSHPSVEYAKKSAYQVKINTFINIVNIVKIVHKNTYSVTPSKDKI